MKAFNALISDDIPKKYIYISVGLAALLPEYLAPFLTLAGFIVFKKHCSLNNKKVKLGDVGKVFLLFMCYSALSFIWSPTPIYSIAISLLWMGMLLGSFYISNIATTRDRLENLVVCFSIGGGAVGFIGFMQYALLRAGVSIVNPLWSIIDKLIYTIMPFSITDTTHVWEATRAASTFDNPLVCATYLLLALPVAAYGFTGGKKANRTICGVSALCIIGGIIGTSSRGAFIAAVFEIFVLLFINSRKIVSVIATLAATATGFCLVLFNRNAIFSMDMGNSTESRLKMWHACGKLIKESPLIGLGAGCQSTAQGMAQYGVNKPHAHSLYVEMTTELGIVGIIFLAVVFGFIFYDIYKLIKQGGIYRRMGLAFLSCIVGFLIASLTEFTLQTPKELQYFMFILGMLEAAKRMAMKEKAEIGRWDEKKYKKRKQLTKV